MACEQCNGIGTITATNAPANVRILIINPLAGILTFECPACRGTGEERMRRLSSRADAAARQRLREERGRWQRAAVPRYWAEKA
jgi:hypothetical protein